MLVQQCGACAHDNRPGAAFCAQCGAALAPDAGSARAPGAPQPFGPGGRYTFVAEIGAGAWKRVYRARDAATGRDVAIAMFEPGSANGRAADLAATERAALERLGTHPHIVPLLDAGTDRDRPYLVLEYVAGGDLAGRLAATAGGALPVAECLRLARQVCDALAHAHARGIVHRDLKPTNVLLTPDGAAKLTDFGLAHGIARTGLLSDELLVGSAAYMAPEQALQDTVDARTDVYALGAILYELLTGRPPFIGRNVVHVITQHVHTPPVHPRALNPEVPDVLGALVLACLAKAPGDRPADTATVAAALDSFHLTDHAPAPDAAWRRAVESFRHGVFIGRDAELRRLCTVVNDAVRGAGRMVLVLGEPGIGKTQLATMARTYAELQGARVYDGANHEGHWTGPYWPWRQVLRAVWAAHADPDALGPDARYLARLVPEALLGPPATAAGESPDSERLLMFTAAVRLLGRAAARAPLLLVIEDVQWADAPTLALLRFLHERLADLPVGVVLTMRTGEHPGAGAAADLAALTAALEADTLDLVGFDPAQVGEFVAAATGGRPTEALCDALHTRTGGNPYFLSEIVRSFVDANEAVADASLDGLTARVPAALADMVSVRLARLPPPVRDVLHGAAVLGPTFDVAVLARALAAPADLVRARLAAAADRGLIAPADRTATTRRFAHAVVADTLSESLPAADRRAWHQRHGEALEAIHADDRRAVAAQLVHHFTRGARRADDEARIVRYAVAAGEQAERQYATAQARAHFSTAVETAAAAPALAGSAAHCDALLGTGRTHRRLGDPTSARVAFRDVAALAEHLGDGARLARAALGFAGDRQPFGKLDEDAIALLTRAAERLGPVHAGLHAKVLSRLALEQTALRSSPWAERDALCRRALTMARELGDPGVLADVLTRSYFATFTPDNLADRLAMAREIRELAERTGDRALEMYGHAYIGTNMLEMDRLDAVDASYAAVDRLADAYPVPMIQWWSAVFRAGRTLMRGDFVAGERLAQEAFGIGQQVDPQNALQLFGTQYAHLRTEQHRFDELEPVLVDYMNEYDQVPSYRIGVIHARAELGRRAEAQAMLDALAARDFADLPRDLAWFWSVALLVETCVALDDRARAACLADLLAPFRGRLVTAGGIACRGAVAYYLGRLAVLGERWRDALDLYEDALATHERLPMPTMVARTLCERAYVLARTGAAGAAALEPDLDRADGIAERIGLPRVRERIAEVRALARRAAG